MLSVHRMVQPEYKVQLYLNSAQCQSPAEISKTKKSMEYIRHFSIISRANNSNEHGVHHITIVLTNNNLNETNMWKIRLNNNFEGQGINVITLSSKKESDINNLNQLWVQLLRCKTASVLPDLIVMCTHEKRTSDLIDMIRILKNGTLNLSEKGIHHISLTIMFDEADKNIKMIKNCLGELDGIITMTNGNDKIDNVVRDIHFITATPLADFWKTLKKCGIDKLKNINHALQTMDENSCLNIPYPELMKQYRYLKDHNCFHEYEDETENPIDYANTIIEEVISKTPGVKTIFAPAGMYKTTHSEMKEALHKFGYDVYVDNSDKNGKGFFYSTGKFESLEVFNKKNNIKGELRDTFVKWRQLYPDNNLAITGYLNVIRGITFNTTGFNFTDFIVSNYHARDLSSLIQLFGRASGDVRYVDIMNIHCPKKVWDTVDSQITIMDRILNANPDDFEEKNFRPKTKREVQEAAWSIPRVFSITQEEFMECTRKTGKNYIRELIYNEIKKHDAELDKILRSLKCFQITQPDKDDTYKKYVIDFKKKAEEGRTFNMGIHKDNKKVDGFQIFLDNRENKIIVSIYYGSRIQEENVD